MGLGLVNGLACGLDCSTIERGLASEGAGHRWSVARDQLVWRIRFRKVSAAVCHGKRAVRFGRHFDPIGLTIVR